MEIKYVVAAALYFKAIITATHSSSILDLNK
jgi:hypothetical protein